MASVWVVIWLVGLQFCDHGFMGFGGFASVLALDCLSAGTLALREVQRTKRCFSAGTPSKECRGVWRMRVWVSVTLALECHGVGHLMSLDGVCCFWKFGAVSLKAWRSNIESLGLQLESFGVVTLGGFVWMTRGLSLILLEWQRACHWLWLNDTRSVINSDDEEGKPWYYDHGLIGCGGNSYKK